MDVRGTPGLTITDPFLKLAILTKVYCPRDEVGGCLPEL
jgi:hypothetical protein